MSEREGTWPARLVASLVRLGQRLDQGVPPQVESAALAANPWFTPYYLREALAGVRSWLYEAKLLAFLAGYGPRVGPPRRVGIIAAGNLPLVGWHDVLITLLAGHRAYVKYATRDRVMMAWLAQCWQEIEPRVADFLHPVGALPAVDFVLATGSNNSARYFRAAFPRTPKLIRQHRYAVAVLDQDLDDESLLALNRDILLYNGLGCRSVSSLLLMPGFDIQRLQESLGAYIADRINPLYLERVLYVDQLYRVLGQSVYRTPHALLQSADEPQDLGMGLLSLVHIDPAQRELSAWQTAYQDRWQCVVGKEVAFGQSQRPKLADFADGVDTLQLLRDQVEPTPC